MRNYKNDQKVFGQKVRAVLTADMIYRRDKSWPLIKTLPENFYTECGKNKGFHGLSKILKKYKGKIVLAGGAVLEKNLKYSIQDVDIFFYGISNEEATKILLDCVEIIIRENVTTKDHNYTNSNNIKIEKKHKVVNVVVYGTKIFQFILRIYPTLDSIIGSFDIPLSMVAYDGEFIYTTPLSDFCFENQRLVVDLSRRSTTFEYRLSKYSYRFKYEICMPGLDKEKYMKDPNDTTKSMELLRKFMRENNLKIKGNINWIASKGDELGNKVKFQVDFFRYNDNDLDYYLNARRQIDLKNVEDDELKRYSDYEKNVIYPELIPKANGTLLKCNNLENLIDCVWLNFDSNEIEDKIDEIMIKFKSIIEEPVLPYEIQFHGDGYYPDSNIKRIKDYGDSIKLHQDNILDLDSIKDVIIKNCEERHKEALKMYKGITWNTFTPGQQWTSSYNPIVEDVRNWYPHYNGFTIGIPLKIENVLRFGRLDKKSILSTLSKDVFRIILRLLVELYANIWEIKKINESFCEDVEISTGGEVIMKL
tara:strand:+ start:3175 stop:4776 length:1602 start_codon:yes stop_codon:yes gene_type:complete